MSVGFGAESERAVSWLKDQTLRDSVSPDEKAFLTIENPSQQRIVEASWRVETLRTLLWSMGIPASFKVSNSQISPNGNIAITYKRDGGVKTGAPQIEGD